MASAAALPAVAAHGAVRLPGVDVQDYNVELKDDEGFIGDRACKGAFQAMVSNWRAALEKVGGDPLGDDDTEALSKRTLDDLLKQGDPEAAGVLQGAVEDFSQEFAVVIRRFLKLKQ